MGGKAFGFESKRMDKNEYQSVIRDILVILRDNSIWNEHDVIAFNVVPSYTNKVSYGDIDILVSHNFNVSKFKSKYSDIFKFKKNGDVLSLLDSENRQIDIIKSKSGLSNYMTHLDYLSYNDLGNLLGRLFKSIDLPYNCKLKYGIDGLSCDVYSDDTNQKIGNIVLEKNLSKILSLLSLSHDRYQKGFDNLDDIFEFVVSSKYFKKSVFDLSGVDNKRRARDKKRKTYMEFLKYIDNMNDSLSEFYKNTNEWDDLKLGANGEHAKLASDKDDKDLINLLNRHEDVNLDFLNDLSELYPSTFLTFINQLSSMRKNYNYTRMFRQKVNPHKIKSMTGYQNKDLGDFMNFLRDNISLYDDIDTQIKYLYNVYIKSK